MDQDQIKKFLSDEYQLKVISIEKLYGFYDENFRITAEDTDYFLKIYDDPDVDNLSFQIALMDVLTINGLPIPQIIKKKLHKAYTTFDKRLVTLQEFISGKQLDDVPLTKHIATDIGKKLGQFHAITQKQHINGKTWKAYKWDLAQFDLVVKEHPEPKLTASTKQLLEPIRRRWGETKHSLDFLQKGVIHGDYHGGNLLIKDEACVAILDFGDAITSWYAADIGIAFYHLFTKTSDESLLAAFLAGYETHFQLPKEEKELLPFFVQLRCAGILLGIQEVPEAIKLLDYLATPKNYERMKFL
jgi:Ser/Thr protein kinase RdoA (MazF antagonist)